MVAQSGLQAAARSGRVHLASTYRNGNSGGGGGYGGGGSRDSTGHAARQLHAIAACRSHSWRSGGRPAACASGGEP